MTTATAQPPDAMLVERVKLFGKSAFWPFSPEEFNALASLLSQPLSTDCLDHVLQVASSFAINKQLRKEKKPNRRDEIARIGRHARELLGAIDDASQETQLSFFVCGHSADIGVDELFELRRKLDAIITTHGALLDNPPKISRGGQAVKREERQLITQMRSAFKAAHPDKRNPQGFWRFFFAVTPPLANHGLSDALAGVSVDPATWQDAWEAIEKRTPRRERKTSIKNKRLNQKRT
jgi:hypothetical protein